MRLIKVWIGHYRNLVNTEIFFNNSPSIYGATSIRFFVGLNGSGKSNALEAIGLIFGHLAVDVDPGIEFDVEFELGENIIRLTNNLRSVAEQLNMLPYELEAYFVPSVNIVQLRRPVDEVTGWTKDHFLTDWSSTNKPIPNRIIGYSSGPTSDLQRILVSSIEQIVRNRVDALESEIRPDYMSEEQWQQSLEELRALRQAEQEQFLSNPQTLFLSSSDSLYAVLALLAHPGLADDTLDYRHRRAETLRLVGLDLDDPLPAFSLRVSSEWESSLMYGQRQAFSEFLSLSTIQRIIDPDLVEDSAKKEDFNVDFYAVFDLDSETRNTIFSTLQIVNPLDFFLTVLAWKRQGAIRELRLGLKKHDIEDLILESALSDGEFLLLGRYAVLLMTRNISETLILLDEPETHFNDRWKVELVKDIHNILEMTEPNALGYQHEVIIATHSDLTLTDADPEQVYLFVIDVSTTHEGKNWSVRVEQPTISTFAANRAEISRLLFNTEGPIGTFSKTMIEKALEDGSRETIERLLDTTGPGFYRFRLRDRLIELEDQEEG